MSTPGRILTRLLLSVCRFSTKNPITVLCVFGGMSLFGFLLTCYSWNPQTSVSGQLNWNHPARQTWENSEVARQSQNDVYFYIHDQNPENIKNAISLLSEFVESNKRFFLNSFSSNDFSLRDENILYQIPVESLDSASASIIKCRKITENHWATLDISNYCQWLTLQLRDNPTDKTVHEDVARFAHGLKSAFQAGVHTPLWNLSLSKDYVASHEQESFGFFAIKLNELDRENRKAALESLFGIRQQVIFACPTTIIELSGIPVVEFGDQPIFIRSIFLCVFGIIITLSIYLFAGFGSIRFHAALLSSLFTGLGCYLGLSAIFLGETNPQTLQVGIIFVFLFLTGAIMMIVHLFHHPAEIRSSSQESILRSVEHYIRTVGTGKGITLLALFVVFIITMYQQSRSLSGIIPENIPSQWLFFAMIAVWTSFIANLVLLPVVLNLFVRFPLTDSKKDVAWNQNPFGKFMRPSWERRILLGGVLLASGFGCVQLLKQFSGPDVSKNETVMLPFHASNDLPPEAASLFHVYDADLTIPKDMALKNKLFHAMRTLLVHVPDSGPEIPVSSPAALDQAIAGLCDELALNPETDAIRLALQEMRQVIVQTPLDHYYRIVSDMQRSTVADLCRQLQHVKKTIPPASVNVAENTEIARRFKGDEKSLFLIPRFSSKQLTEHFSLLENHVRDLTGYSLLKHYVSQQTHKSSLTVILFLCCVFVFGFLLFNTSFKQSFLSIAIFITAIAAFSGMIGFLEIPVSNTVYFAIFTQLTLIPILTTVMKKTSHTQNLCFSANHFATILLITGACIVFSGHLLFLENDVLLLTGRMIIIGWVAIFMSLYLWFPEAKADSETTGINEVTLDFDEMPKRENIAPDPQKHFPVTTAVSLKTSEVEDEKTRDHCSINPKIIEEPVTQESVMLEPVTQKPIEEVAVASDQENPENQNFEPVIHKKTSFCKVWSIGRKSLNHKAMSKTNAAKTPVILSMNRKSESNETASRKEVA